MKQHSHLENLLAENDPIPVGRCATCQRSGLPILPLRTAFAPPAGDIEADVTSARLGRLRTLRQGYLYVLLDAQVWQAYAVTEQGLLRQFVPLQMPLDPPAPIAEHCIRENHHLPASFINIDTARYSKAWLAFANDPWPAEVLDRYKHAIAGGGSPLEARFREIDLALAREQPAQLGIAMTAEQVGLEAVLEFATPQLDNFTSAHGFCARWSLPHVFQAYIQTLIEREHLPQGVLALTLDDPVGVLQELNAQRLARFEAMLQWRAEPQRRFEHFTSQTLLGLRAAYERSAEAQAEQAIKEERAQREQWNAGYFGEKVTLPPVNATVVTAQHRQEALARLEERYDERARAAFDTAYHRDLERWQKSVDALGELYAHYSTDTLFALIIEHDYSADCSRSLEGFILMVSAVLGGGPTERLPAEDQALGATQALWQRLLEDTGSLFYQSLLAKHGPLLEQVKTGLAGDDLGKVYDWVKSLITSEDGKQLMTTAVQNATALLLAAANNAQHTLGPRLSRQAQALVGHLHSITLLRYAGQSLTPMTVQLTAGEYLKLLNNTLRTRTEAFIKTLDETLRKPGQAKVRATVMNAAFTAAISTQS
ncbi:T6SS effector BTH_I2691 family protein, partial [Pseudomonas sp. URIL14HWK12:I11]|uniref:T6SS effector BTH_I2691 family protein n=2 Tax=unclassified Pseudomonas TaxID=196821 RepID=UPI000D5FA469